MHKNFVIDALNRDFIFEGLEDDWTELVADPASAEFLTPYFKERHMGLVFDNAENFSKAYTAVFPSPSVLKTLFETGETDLLLFTHHPMHWDITAPPPFAPISSDDLLEMMRRRISLYTLHVPLDRNGPFGTTANLAEALGVERVGEFFEYFGAQVGIIGRTAVGTVSALSRLFSQAVGHDVKVYGYGDETISNGLVALVAGGGNDKNVAVELRGRGINCFVTGITRETPGFQPAVESHAAMREAEISLLGGTHYSTEKFACMKMTGYFETMGLPASFLVDTPGMDDM